MFWNPSASDILVHWQNEIEQRLEAGVTPILELGVSSLTTDSTASLLALQLLAARRVDAFRPVVPVGGAGAAWLAVLMQPAPPPSAQGVPEPAVLYTGANLAEHMASLALLHSAGHLPAMDRSRDAGPLSSYFQPQSQPGFSAPWETLPFLQAGATGAEPIRFDEGGTEPTADWLAWAVLLLALLLVILAILL